MGDYYYFMYRAIGDVALKPYVTSEPEIIEKDIGLEDEYLVLASDGLWDVLRNEGRPLLQQIFSM
jgi:serine/threonine protein phosphatase PrpC